MERRERESDRGGSEQGVKGGVDIRKGGRFKRGLGVGKRGLGDGYMGVGVEGRLREGRGRLIRVQTRVDFNASSDSPFLRSLRAT